MINKKQIMVVALVLVIITAGVLQYTYGKSGYSAKNDDSEERLGEAVYVDNINDDKLKENGDMAQADKTANTANSPDDYFAQARIDRETIRSRQKEELDQLSSSGEAGGESTAIVQEEYLKLLRRSEIEATIESLVKQRGFPEAVVILGTNGSVDLVVKADSLSQAQTAQISDIIMRHAGVEMGDIHIKNMN